MAYILIVVKDSRKLRAVRLAKEKAEALEKEAAKMDVEKEALHQESKEKESNEEEMPKGKVGCKALFDLTNVLDGIKTVIKKRDNHKRTLLLLTILVFELEIFIIVSTQAIHSVKWENLGVLLALHSLFTSYIFLAYTLQSNNKWCTRPPDTERKNQLHIACAVLESTTTTATALCGTKTNTYSSDVSLSLQ